MHLDIVLECKNLLTSPEGEQLGIVLHILRVMYTMVADKDPITLRLSVPLWILWLHQRCVHLSSAPSSFFSYSCTFSYFFMVFSPLTNRIFFITFCLSHSVSASICLQYVIRDILLLPELNSWDPPLFLSQYNRSKTLTTIFWFCLCTTCTTCTAQCLYIEHKCMKVIWGEMAVTAEHESFFEVKQTWRGSNKSKEDKRWYLLVGPILSCPFWRVAFRGNVKANNNLANCPFFTHRLGPH